MIPKVIFHVYLLVAPLASAVSMSSRARQEALRAAIAMRPSEAARIDILNMQTTAASAPITTVDAGNFPEDVWRGCPAVDPQAKAHMKSFFNLSEPNLWSRDSSMPLVVEQVKQGCLLRGKPGLNVPLLTWIYSLPADKCKERLTDHKIPLRVEQQAFPNLEGYTVFWPPEGKCESSPCPVVFHIHGLVDEPLEFGYPRLMLSNTSICPEELGVIVVAPELPKLKKGSMNMVRLLGSPERTSAVFIDFVESFLDKYNNIVDRSRIYTTGLSNGAQTAVAMAVRRPDIFTLAVGTDIKFTNLTWYKYAVSTWPGLKGPHRLTNIVVSQGENDISSASFLSSITKIHETSGLGHKVHFQARIYQGIAHGTWDAVWYQWPDLYEIMFLGTRRLNTTPALTSWILQIIFLVVLAMAHAVLTRQGKGDASKNGRNAPAGQTLDSATKSDSSGSSVGAVSIVKNADAHMKPIGSTPPMSDVANPDPPVAGRADPLAVHTLHGIFEEAVARRPDDLCIKVVGHRGMSYAELGETVQRCCAHVAVLDDDVIGLAADRSYEMIISILSVLRAGKAYCPVEPEWPAARSELIFTSASIAYVMVPELQHPQDALSTSKMVSVLLVRSTGQVLTADGTIARQDSSKIPAEVPDNVPAYVLFTSGSTGKPKGCVVPHRGSAIYSKYVGNLIKLDSGKSHAFKVPYVFDPSVRDIFMCMVSGGTLAIAPPGTHVDARELVDWIIQERVGYSNFAPTLLVEFINYLKERPRDLAAIRPVLKWATCGGEALLSATVTELKEMLPELELLNVYGPTECSIDTSHFRTKTPFQVPSTVVPIGWPTPHVQYRVYDPEMTEGKTITESLLQAVPDGSPGELFIGGDCLAHGYLGEPEKTAAVFFNFPNLIPRPPRAASPYSMYKTGDLVQRRTIDGACEFLGRVDFQVKVHGVRIECEEVTSVIKTHPVVNDAFVTKFEGPHGDALVAYVVPSLASEWAPKKKDGDFDTEAQQACNDSLSAWLSKTHLLPVMHPSVYILIKQLPLTTTGKVDRKSLPSANAHLDLVKGTEVVDSLGRIRRIRTDAEAVFNNLMMTVLSLNCVGIILCHWLPTDITWAEPSMLYATRWVTTYLQQASNFNFLALFLLLGYRTRRQSKADTRDDIIALSILLLLLGWPYWAPSLFAGIATFHRYTCVTLLASHFFLNIFESMKMPAMLQVLIVIGAALVVGPYPVVIPGIPDGATSVWEYPGLLLLEPQFFGSWGLQFTMVLLFLLGFHGAIAAENYIRRVVVGSTPRKKLIGRSAIALVFFLLVLVPVRSSSENLSSTADNVYMAWDVMGSSAYRTTAYPLNLCRWLLTILCMIGAFGDGHWIFHRIGRNFVGVYLVHMYLTFDLLGMLKGLQPYGFLAQVIALVGVPVLFTFSIGAIAQDCIAAAFRTSLNVQTHLSNMAWNSK